jgi:hypothetical protein
MGQHRQAGERHERIDRIAYKRAKLHAKAIPHPAAQAAA